MYKRQDINNKVVTHFATINRKLLLSQYPIKGRNGGMGMIVTTTVSVEGRRITEYKGMVFGEVISGVNFVRDVAASFSNFFGGRSGSYEAVSYTHLWYSVNGKCWSSPK